MVNEEGRDQRVLGSILRDELLFQSRPGLVRKSRIYFIAHNRSKLWALNYELINDANVGPVEHEYVSKRRKDQNLFGINNN